MFNYDNVVMTLPLFHLLIPLLFYFSILLKFIQRSFSFAFNGRINFIVSYKYSFLISTNPKKRHHLTDTLFVG